MIAGLAACELIPTLIEKLLFFCFSACQVQQKLDFGTASEVGCDPLLRERIWQQLVQFADQEQITILITTHYIEEARRSHLVGFMKKGYLMSENTPENLYQMYETKSLERIFYQLCVNEKLRKGSILKRIESKNAEKSLLKKRESQSQPRPQQSADELRRNFYFYGFEP